jgi:hypothetical protein
LFVTFKSAQFTVNAIAVDAAFHMFSFVLDSTANTSFKSTIKLVETLVQTNIASHLNSMLADCPAFLSNLRSDITIFSSVTFTVPITSSL